MNLLRYFNGPTRHSTNFAPEIVYTISSTGRCRPELLVMEAIDGSDWLATVVVIAIAIAIATLRCGVNAFDRPLSRLLTSKRKTKK